MAPRYAGLFLKRKKQIPKLLPRYEGCNISDRVTANNETERRIQGLESPTPTDTQYSTELEAINTEEESSYTDVKPFRVKIVSNKYEEFLNMYQFLWIQEITRELYLFIEMAEYDILRGQDLKTFSQKLEEVFSLELREKYSVKEERLNYQKRKSKGTIGIIGSHAAKNIIN